MQRLVGTSIRATEASAPLIGQVMNVPKCNKIDWLLWALRYTSAGTDVMPWRVSHLRDLGPSLCSWDPRSLPQAHGLNWHVRKPMLNILEQHCISAIQFCWRNRVYSLKCHTQLPQLHCIQVVFLWAPSSMPHLHEVTMMYLSPQTAQWTQTLDLRGCMPVRGKCLKVKCLWPQVISS